ncbi:MAG TPA: aspartyl/glutamyl-tRNA amidotransferase subunit C [Longimicrobiaceae bacterium]|jgi:aspartyl-tRNA(Asn)/glutamyl-tRNA(Gln) amidotransferase subunit C|nr:aspartyl/glutamyl-tRNA amidotransferase subunit C [Longimicrobiaceae bacterium]
MAVSPHEVAHVARLARLRLDPGEVDRLCADLGTILGHANELARVDVSDLEPPASGAAPCALRSDDGTAESMLRPPELIAPVWAHPFFSVPRLASHAAIPAQEQA